MSDSTTPKVILLVEDDPDIAGIMELLLEEEGYYVHILQTIDPERAVLLKADLIIMDQKLKGILGADLCSRLKENKESEHIPILLCSAAHDLSALKDECHASGYISKPFAIDEFISMVAKLVSPSVSN